MLVNIEHLRKHYKNFDLDCSLQVEAGKVVGLIGANGAGKTTTFKALLDLIRVDVDQMTLFDKNYHTLDMSDKQKIGVVLHDAGFSEHLTIKGIIAILKNFYPSFEEDAFKTQCATFGLPIDKKLKAFSTGMNAKLKLLVALSHHPHLLILDEPTAGLDVVARDELLDILRAFMEDEQHAILISSHISSDLENLCDEFYMINKGCIVLHEDTDVLLSSYGILKVNEQQYQQLDKSHLLKIKKEGYGYKCLTQEKQYYMDNYPHIVVEKGSMDEMIMMMVKGDNI